MNRILVGQIGVCHEHAAAKMRSLRQLPETFEIVGVADDRASRSPRFVDADLTAYDGLPWRTEAELLRIAGLQAVLVETANGDLVPTALRCMERHLAIHMDKPGGEDLALFGQLLRGCAERKLPFQMGYMFRHNPAMRFCLNAVRQKWLGDIFEVQAAMSHNYGGPAYQHYLGHFKGGIMFNLGCHLIDLIVAMLGRPEQITPFLKSAPGDLETVKNNALTVLEYPHATATIRACSYEVDGLPHRRLKVCGTRGTAELCPLERFDGQALAMRLSLLDDHEPYAAGTHSVDFGVQRDRYADQLLELAKLVRGEIANPYTVEHDYLVQEVLLAASGYTEWKA